MFLSDHFGPEWVINFAGIRSVYLLLAYLKFASKISRSFQQILQLLQLNLFERRDLQTLLRGDPPAPKLSHLQTTLQFS